MQPVTVPKRKPKRSRVFLTAEVDSGMGPVTARIRDISRSGALVEADPAPESGTRVRLKCGDTVVDGRVAWAERRWFGLEFVTPLLTAQVIDRAGTQLAVSAPRTYRSGDILD